MKALILAAGVGKRLRQCTNGKPKCLIDICGKTILEHQLSRLKNVGIVEENVIIVTGYKAEYIKKIAGIKITYIHNSNFKSTNSLYSMWLARKENFDDGFILLNSDVMFHRKILNKLLNKNGNVAAVDFNKKLQDGEMNVIVKNKEEVIKISKKIKAKDANGESVQITKFDNAGSKLIFKKADEIIKAGYKKKFPANIYKYIIKNLRLFALDIDNLPWIEIDYPKDLLKAKQIKWE